MKSSAQPCVYIMTNKNNSTLYIGVTNDILRRVAEHKAGQGSKFAKRYNLDKLVYVELTDRIEDAIAREKQLKAGPRQVKLDLINELNPDWNDLYEQHVG